MSMHHGPFQSLFAYKAWASSQLLALLEAGALADDAKTSHTVLRILNHAYVVDRIFQANVQGIRHGFTALNTPETPAAAALHAATRGLDQWYLDYIATLSPDQINDSVAFTFVDGGAGVMTRAQMLMHVATHGAYHRGEVGRLLESRGIEAPPDSLSKFLVVAHTAATSG